MKLLKTEQQEDLQKLLEGLAGLFGLTDEQRASCLFYSLDLKPKRVRRKVGINLPVDNVI